MKADVMSESTDAGDIESADEESQSGPRERTSTPRRVSLSLRALAVGVLLLALAVIAATTTWLYLEERGVVNSQNRDAADRAHAEQVAMDYAVNAAAMNYQELGAWKGKLVNGTTPELHDKLAKAANSMEQLLVPLQWTSTAKPLAAKARSQGNGAYVVDTFVNVVTKTTQAPDNLQSTATYSVTIDSHNNWLITDVGGIGAVVGGK